MEENKNNQPSNQPHPDMTTLKGVLLTAFGFLLMLFSYRIVLHMILFISGVYFIFLGLSLLNIPKINGILAKIKEFVKHTFVS